MPGAVGFSNRAVSSAHGAACAVGAILARLATAAKTKPEAIASAAASSLSPLSSEGNPPGSGAWAALSDDALPSVLSAVAAAIGHPVSLLHIAACDAIGRVGAAGALPLRSAAAGKNLDTSQGGVAAAVATAAVVATPAASIVGAAGEDRATTVQAVFAQLWDACKLGETTDASRRAEAAAEALGRCCRGEGSVGREGIEGASIETASSRLRKTLLVLFEMAKNQVCDERPGIPRTKIGLLVDERADSNGREQVREYFPTRLSNHNMASVKMSRGNTVTVVPRLPLKVPPSSIPFYP